MSIPNPASMSISFRINHRTESQFRQNDRHDLRKGPQPKYVDSAKSFRNTVVVPYLSVAEIKSICVERRNIRETKRATKSNAAIASTFLISFGKGLQAHVSVLSADDQDRLYSAVSHAIGLRLGQKVSGLCAHRDETADHAHGSFPALRSDGYPLSKYITPTVASDLQQIAEDAARPFLPMIQRRKTKVERRNDSEPASAIYHRSVKQLHDDLPREITALQGRLKSLHDATDLAQARVDEMQLRVSNLDAKAELSEKEIKRKGVYEKRLADRLVELQAAQSASEAARIEADRLSGLAHADRKKQEDLVEKISAKAVAVGAAVAALSSEIKAGTIRRTLDGKIRAAQPDLLTPAFPELRSAVAAAADLVTAMDADQVAIDVDQRELEEGQRALKRQQMSLQMGLQEIDRLRVKLRRALSIVARWLRRPELSDDFKSEGQVLIEDVRPLLSPPEDSGEDSGPGF